MVPVVKGQVFKLQVELSGYAVWSPEPVRMGGRDGDRLVTDVYVGIFARDQIDAIFAKTLKVTVTGPDTLTVTPLVSNVGEVERWDIVNETMMDHPIHIHGTQFRLASRESRGIATPARYAAWLDTVDVPSGTTATIRVRQDLPGKRMVHCHILEHEDAGMMAVLDVRP